MDFQDNIEKLRDSLLDMSLRNRLLNFKPQKKSIEIVDEDVASLYDILVVKGHKMKFRSNETLDEEALLDNAWDSNSELKDVHVDLFLQTKYEPDELQKRLKHNYRDNKTILEEQGYNDFYLALGFIEWKEIDHEENIHKAPLVLVPMKLERSSVSQPMTISWNGEEIRSNLSVIYKLQEQGVEIPDFEEFDTKEELVDYLKKIEKIISNKHDWKISKEIYLSNFNFKKFVMFKDLDLDNWPAIRNNPIKNIFNVSENETFEINDLDLNSISSIDIFNVLDADSSQLAVLEEAKMGKNLVVEGPPGTGKSQTIVNLIAELMAMGKKVLFVSEKKAALDVVKSRLDSVDLGIGCLELHGKNSNKKIFLNELEDTLKSELVQIQNDADFLLLDDIKNELNEYVDTLHSIYKNTELTPYRLIGMYESYSQKLDKNSQKKFKLDVDDVSNLNQEKRGEIIRRLDEIVKYYELVSPVKSNIWSNTSPEELNSPDLKQIKEELLELSSKLNRFSKIDNNVHILIGINKLNSLNMDSLIDNSKLLSPDLKLLNEKDNLEELVNDIEVFQNNAGNMNLDVLDLDLNTLQNEIDNLLENIDNLNINMDILDKEDFKSINENFKSNKLMIEKSNLENALKNPNLEVEFNEFKAKRNSFLKRVFDSNFKRIKNNFKSYYTTDVDDEQIENDFEKVIKANNDLTKLRNKILAYSKLDTNNDDKILIESEKLLSWASELDNIKSNLSTYHISVRNNTMKEKINKLIELRGFMQKIKSRDDIGLYYFGDDWESNNSDVKILNTKLNNIKQFKKYYDEDYFNDQTLYFLESNQFDALNNHLKEMSDVKTEIIKKYNDINTKLHFKNELLVKDFNTVNVSCMKQVTDNLLANIENLNDYRLFARYCKEYADEYTKDLIEYINQDSIQSNLITDLFHYNFANIALTDIFSNEMLLDEFNCELHEVKIDKFKTLDKKIISSNKFRVLEVLGSNRPNMNIAAAPGSSLGMLKKEMGKKRKIKPIRKILSEARDVISSIKPCFMMSPLSIAQYLDPKIYESYFDYIIFDEASQVKIEDSIGALLRGNNYIVMGDTKQLPPTNFFEKESDINDEDDEEGIADNLESILHLCKNSFDTKMLKWHYRSRHESLISVSNQEFYNNDLYVFPSPTKESEDLGLKFQYDPTTVYDRGGNRNNIKEAENVVEYAFNCFRKWGNSRSLGIGTFNIAQRNTIMDVLEKKLKDNPDLEKFFNGDGEEGFFVKNLENIQGDERDIIIISLGYGRDQNNKLSLSFGPLNKEGGERRLNVLITRAKQQCIVFTNFKSSEMHTTEKTPRGVETLKTFLYYAEKGKFPENYHTGDEFDSPFEKSVYNFLTDEGYIVEKQVGCAGYKIDLAIVDKDDANRYILGIECDGATYHSSPLARDRDRLRQEVLEGLGWKFHRIWSTDWFHKNLNAKQRLLDVIEETVKTKDNKKLAKKSETQFEPDIIIKTQEDKKQEELDKYFEDYVYYKHNGSCNLQHPQTIISELISTEAPIHIDDIYDVMKTIYGKKATKKFKDKINDDLHLLMAYGNIIEDNMFFFPKKFNWENMKVRFRESPKIEHIYSKEIEKSIISALKLQYSTSKEDLIKSASKYLGFKSVRSKVKDKFETCINNLINKKIIRDKNGVMELMK